MRLLTHLQLAAQLKSWHQLQTMNSASASNPLQRVAIRLSLPFYSTSGALHVFPWLEQAIYTHVPSLRPAGLAGMHGCRWTVCLAPAQWLGSLFLPRRICLLRRKLSPSCHCAGHPAYQPSTSSTVNAGLAQLAVVHEALEDVTRGLPEAAREAAAVGVLAAAGAAIMRAHMRAGAADELLALRCLQPLVSGEQCNKVGCIGCPEGWLLSRMGACCPPLCRAQPMLAKSAQWCLGCCRLVCLQVDVGPAVAAPAFKTVELDRGLTTCYTRSLLRHAHPPHPGPPQTLAPLSQHVRKLAAAAELLERAARSMRLPADGWARATWEVLSALQL